MIAFITLTNTGYINYTFNCLKSLENIKSPIMPVCYCIGNEGYLKLKEKGYQCVRIDEEKDSAFQSFRKGNWSDIVFHKFHMIHENLLTNDYVLITDGDIVYESDKFLSYLMENIGDNDMLIQNDRLDDTDDTLLCSGFMFIKSSKLTIDLFNPVIVKKFQQKEKWGDQTYLNHIKNDLKYTKLPLDLFPNGAYYYKHSSTIAPFMIHFNWVVGHDKLKKMRKFNKWYV